MIHKKTSKQFGDPGGARERSDPGGARERSDRKIPKSFEVLIAEASNKINKLNSGVPGTPPRPQEPAQPRAEGDNSHVPNSAMNSCVLNNNDHETSRVNKIGPHKVPCDTTNPSASLNTETINYRHSESTISSRDKYRVYDANAMHLGFVPKFPNPIITRGTGTFRKKK